MSLPAPWPDRSGAPRERIDAPASPRAAAIVAAIGGAFAALVLLGAYLWTVRGDVLLLQLERVGLCL